MRAYVRTACNMHKSLAHKSFGSPIKHLDLMIVHSVNWDSHYFYEITDRTWFLRLLSVRYYVRYIVNFILICINMGYHLHVIYFKIYLILMGCNNQVYYLCIIQGIIAIIDYDYIIIFRIIILWLYHIFQIYYVYLYYVYFSNLYHVVYKRPLHFNGFSTPSRVTFESFSVQDRYINGTPKSCRISIRWWITIETRGNKHGWINLLNGQVTWICARNFVQTEGAPCPEDCLIDFMHIRRNTHCSRRNGCDMR